MARPAHSGVTLVEVLAALVVVAVGLLGGLALVIDGLRASRSALQQTQAALLASDLGDRIRANRVGGLSYALDAGNELAAPALACEDAGECGPADVAARDLYEWQRTVLGALPGASTEVTVVPVAGGFRYSIALDWAADVASGSATIVLTVQA